MSSQNDDNRRMSKEELEQAMEERRAKRAKAKARHERRTGKASAETQAERPARHVRSKRTAKTETAEPAETAESSGKKGFRPYMCLLLGPVFALFEILLSVLTGSGFLHIGVIPAFGLGLILGALCSLLSEKPSFVVATWLMEIVTVAFLVEYFCYNTYRVYMSMKDITTGAGDVVAGFGGVVVGLILRGIPIILLFHIPLILMNWKRKSLGYRKPGAFKAAGIQATSAPTCRRKV